MKEIKRLLLKEKETILSEIREKTEINGVNKTEIGDAIDSSVEDQERELDLLLQEREQTRLEGIEIALTRIESDDFGYCDECGEEISKKRLLAVPLARTCLLYTSPSPRDLSTSRMPSSA